MAGRIARHLFLALGLTTVAAVAMAANTPQLAMRFDVTGMRLVLPVLPEDGSRPPAQFYARSATGTMAQALVVFAADVTGSARVQWQPDLAAQDSTLSSPSAVLGQPTGTVVFPEGLHVRWTSGELTATSAHIHDSIVNLVQPKITTDRLRLQADHGVIHLRAAQDSTSAASSSSVDASFTTNVRVVLR